MRKYQRKQVKQIRDLYNSNDPLRWLFISIKLGIWRAPTKREQKLLARRVAKMVRGVAKAATEAIQVIGVAARNAGKTMQAIATAFTEKNNAGN